VHAHITKQQQQLQCGALRAMARAGSMQEGRYVFLKNNKNNKKYRLYSLEMGVAGLWPSRLSL
jgi:hypothetical protein